MNRKKLIVILVMLLALACLSGCEANSDPGYRTVFFGKYEQDNQTGNGKESIKWLVLDEKDGKSLLLSLYGLDAAPYHRAGGNITWQECSIRSWLNNYFLDTAFAQDEKDAISEEYVDNRSENGGYDTLDKVFLLSYEEAGKYFSDDVSRMCAPTDYAVAQGASTGFLFSVNGQAPCSWWLRSPGFMQGLASFVDYDGFRSRERINSVTDAVRPALWVSSDFLYGTNVY